MKNPPNIQSARVMEPGVIELVWSTGETLNISLADPTFFTKMERNEWGHGIGRPGGN